MPRAAAGPVNHSAAALVPWPMVNASLGAQARLHLLNANRDAISVMLGRAVGGGLEPTDAVVIVLDQRDPVGRELAAAAAEKASLDADEVAERVQGRGPIPTVIIVVPLAGARHLFTESHPEVQRGLARSTGPRQVRVVVIAEGAAMLVHAEVSPARALDADSSS